MPGVLVGVISETLSVFLMAQEVGIMLPSVLCSIREQANYSLTISHFIALAADNVWSVRRACAQALPTMIKVIIEQGSSVATQQSVLTTHLSLCRDKSNWVKIAALMSLGPVLMELDEVTMDDGFLDHYASMATVRFGYDVCCITINP